MTHCMANKVYILALYPVHLDTRYPIGDACCAVPEVWWRLKALARLSAFSFVVLLSVFAQRSYSRSAFRTCSFYIDCRLEKGM